MSREYQIPGGIGVQETGTRQYQIPGSIGVNETVAVGGGGIFHIFFSKVIRPAGKNSFLSPVITGRQIC